MDEKAKEYRYLRGRQQKLEAENTLLARDPNLKDLLQQNKDKLAELQTRCTDLEKKIQLRYKVNAAQESVSSKRELLVAAGIVLPEIGDMVVISTEEQLKDAKIQKDCMDERHKKRDTLVIKFASFVGMSLAATSALALFTLCPAALPTIGLAITVVVSCLYLFRHFQEAANRRKEIVDGVGNKLSAVKRSVGTLFSPSSVVVPADGARLVDNFAPDSAYSLMALP